MGDDVKTLEQQNAQLSQELQEQKSNLARLQERHMLREASDFVAGELARTSLPDVARARLLRDLSQNPPVKEGRLDEAALKTKIDAAVQSETQYLVEVTGAGKITGMGSSLPADSAATHQQLVEAFQRTGLTPEQAAIAARGR